MRQFLQSLWWWTRVAVLVVVGGYAMTLLWRNSGQPPVKLWYWFGQPIEETSIIALAIASFMVGGILCTTALALFNASVRYRRTMEQRRQRLAEERRDEIGRKAAMLRVKPAPIARTREPVREGSGARGQGSDVPAREATPASPALAPSPISPPDRPMPARASAVVTLPPTSPREVPLPPPIMPPAAATALDDVAEPTWPTIVTASRVEASPDVVAVEVAHPTPFASDGTPITPHTASEPQPEPLPIVGDVDRKSDDA